MSSLHFNFLYPMNRICSLGITKSAFRRIRLSNRASSLQTRSFTVESKRQAGLVHRHGKAVEPHTIGAERAREKTRCDELRSINKKGRKVKIYSSKHQPASLSTEKDQVSAKSMINKKTHDPEVKNIDKTQNSQEIGSQNGVRLTSRGTVLHLSPEKKVEEQNTSKPANFQKPHYVHHFDTYTQVHRVQEGGFTLEQSITTMKAVRALLAMNLGVAKASLVSKSDVENQSYLFRAASSELKTEIQSMRCKNDEAMRRERTLLQHEVDILIQKLSQELLTLKEEIKGMFDDRKMSVRMDQRSMESKIQELNYKITVLLKSDTKSEVEVLRWVLTRRSVMGILFMAFMVLTSVRYASYKSHENELRKKRDAEIKMEGNLSTFPPQGAAEILAAS
ncbi:putative moz protein represents a chromatin-associated acetyltransferase protein [Erysiphe neolycopersici]|uniref:Putative moz protein represents a chromatin-associated acetyltransferase protein n=1 Tax=Erysiphe neolycopersici TaxID=212602 RepID=A0A420HWR4_9PEZI|nr:putative moz protein represents a chromatin-associated acetyltransferase protein [Erysiphe neolycopersici]